MAKHKNRHATAAKRRDGGTTAAKQHPAGAVQKKPQSSRLSADRYLIVAVLVVAGFFGAYSVSRAGNRPPSAAAPAASVARVENGVQKIDVQVGYAYNPDVIRLKSGIPAEITFSQAQGCTAIVQSQDLGFQEDLSGGAKTVKLQGLQPGTYSFACGMNMVRGQVVVE